MTTHPGPTEPPDDDDPGEPTYLRPPTTTSIRGGDISPHDDDAERVVLGAAMLDPTMVAKASTILTAADFYSPHHETIWRAITALHADGHPTDPAAVRGHLLDTGQLTAINRAGVDLADLMANAPLTGDATWHAERIDSLARRRLAITELTRGLQRLRNPGPDTDVDTVLDQVTSHFTTARDNLANPIGPTTWRPVDLNAVLAGEYLDPPPVTLRRTDGVALFYQGAVHSVAGESESGKTWLTLLAAVQEIEDAHDVAFLDFEDRADRVVGRLLGLGAHPDAVRKHFRYIRPDRPLDDDGRAQVAPALANATLAIIDGVTEAMTLHGYDLNSNEDSAKFQGLLPRWIADHGPATVLIDHVVKDKEKQGRFALGAQHKLAGLDGVAYIVHQIQPFARGRRGLARIDIGKDRPGHVREHAFGRTIAEFTLDATVSDEILIATLSPPGEASGRRTADGPFEPTFLMEKISRYVQANPGMSKKAIEAAMNGKAATIRLALELLVTRGFITTKVESRGRVAHVHIRPYYDDPDTDLNDEPTDEPTDAETDLENTPPEGEKTDA